MVIVIGRGIEAVPKSKPLVQLRSRSSGFWTFGGIQLLHIQAIRSRPPYMHFSMHYFKTQVLNLTNALFQLRYDARRCFVSDANFAFQLCLFFRFILLLSLSKIIEGKNGLK